MNNLVFAGGGIRGAYQVGMMRYLNETKNPISHVSGCSIGNINACLFAQHDIEKAEQLWKNIKSKDDFFNSFTFGYIEGFLKGGLFDNSNLFNLIQKNIDIDKLRNSDIMFTGVTVNYNTSEKVYFDRLVIDLHRYILASAALWIATPPVKINNELYIDGGAKEPIPVKIVCDLNPNFDKTIILLCKPNKSTIYKSKNENLMNVIMRTMDLMYDEIYTNDLIAGLDKYWNNDKFIIVEPIEDIFDSGLDVDPVKINKAIEIGYNSIKQIMEK